MSEADEGGVVAFALAAFAVVVGAGGGVVQGGEGGQEERPLELLVPAAGWVFPADRGSRASGHGCQAGVGGEVAGGGEGGGVTDFEQDAGCGPDPDAWHGGQDVGERVGIEDLLHLGGDLAALGQVRGPGIRPTVPIPRETRRPVGVGDSRRCDRHLGAVRWLIVKSGLG